MKKPIKMINIIKHLPSDKWFPFSGVTGLRMTAPVFAARIKEYREDGTIKSKLVNRHTQFFISQESRMRLIDLLAAPEVAREMLSSELFTRAMRA